MAVLEGWAVLRIVKNLGIVSPSLGHFLVVFFVFFSGVTVREKTKKHGKGWGGYNDSS